MILKMIVNKLWTFSYASDPLTVCIIKSSITVLLIYVYLCLHLLVCFISEKSLMGFFFYSQNF